MQNSLSQSTSGPAGSPIYMAPEQFKGKPRRASDQYAVGVMLYEWLCGVPPFQGRSFLELMDQHISVSAPSLRSKNVYISEIVESVILQSLEKDPQKRFKSIEAFANAFDQACRSHRPVQAEQLQPNHSIAISQ